MAKSTDLDGYDREREPRDQKHDRYGKEPLDERLTINHSPWKYGNFSPGPLLAQHTDTIKKAGQMMCPFCKQEVDEPCKNTVEMQRRASDHIERCNKAMKSLRGVVYG
jgi:hypothetical protein